MKFLVAAFIVATALCGCKFSVSSGDEKLPAPTAGTAAEQEEAAAAARRYLALIDQEKYDETWRQAGPALRDETNNFLWRNTLKLTHKAFGTPANREIEGFGFSTRIEANVPVGEYVLVQFKSPSGNTTATEKVVMQKEAGAWKIVGYFVEKGTRVSNH
ncbi:MAG TPA: DUF4019 domain-containing protein [Luteimonas sp.]|nr:DUF4019 domain-containing protein [Luteimonas sp.]